MKVYDATSLRNVALVGHSGSGKTQLVSALLFDAGAVNRLGKVDEGTTVTDYDEEEIARKHTLSASVAYAEWNKTKINFIDTPGLANFLSDARAALRVADAALVVVDSLHGVEVSTEKVWETADALSMPRLIALNRLDRERASLERSLESLRGVFGRTVIPIQLPIGEEKAFAGVIDLVAMKACMFANDGSGKPVDGAIPGGMIETANAAREALIEMVAEADDGLMEKFFDAGTLSQDDLVVGLKRGVAAARIFPVLLTSATANIGMQPLLDALVAYVPSPAERPLQGARRGRRRGGDRDEGRRRRVRVRLEDGRRSVRRTDHAVPRALGHAEGGLDAAQRRPRHAGAARPPDPAAGQVADQRPGDQGRRHRRGGQAEGDADERRRSPTRVRRSRSRRSPSRRRSSRTRSSRRAAATRRRSAPRCTGCRRKTRRSTTRATRRPRSCSSPARDSRTSRSRSPSSSAASASR